MEGVERIPFSMLHDLALIYLVLAHQGDDRVNPAESRMLALKLRSWEPDKNPALIQHAIREAMLTFSNGDHQAMLDGAVEALRDSLPPEDRELILQDLMAIAQADGSVTTPESEFIRRMGDAWGVSPHRDAGPTA